MNFLKWFLFALAALFVALPLIVVGIVLWFVLVKLSGTVLFRDYSIYLHYAMVSYGALALYVYVRYGLGIANALVPVRSVSSAPRSSNESTASRPSNAQRR
jgi:hypothetical protein